MANVAKKSVQLFYDVVSPFSWIGFEVTVFNFGNIILSLTKSRLKCVSPMTLGKFLDHLDSITCTYIFSNVLFMFLSFVGENKQIL